MVELKLAFSLDVLFQAVNRLSVSPVVYIGIPSTCKAFRKRRRHALKLMKMLGLGLILISINSKRSRVEVVLDPGEYRPRIHPKRQTKLLGEFERRRGDTMPGGSGRRRGMMTAYRQKAIRIAQYLNGKWTNQGINYRPCYRGDGGSARFSIGMSTDGLIDWVKAFTGFHQEERPTSPPGTIAPRFHELPFGRVVEV